MSQSTPANIKPGATVVQYADDLQILVTGRKQEISELVSSMEGFFVVLADWFSTYGMNVSSTKTQLMVHGTRIRELQQIQIRLDPLSYPRAKL